LTNKGGETKNCRYLTDIANVNSNKAVVLPHLPAVSPVLPNIIVKENKFEIVETIDDILHPCMHLAGVMKTGAEGVYKK